MKGPNLEQSMVEQNVASYATPYRYIGQELDVESGYYYGVRYYDPSVSQFQSVDALADKMPYLA